jgi:hypothetical protein
MAPVSIESCDSKPPINPKIKDTLPSSSHLSNLVAGAKIPKATEHDNLASSTPADRTDPPLSTKGSRVLEVSYANDDMGTSKNNEITGITGKSHGPDGSDVASKPATNKEDTNAGPYIAEAINKDEIVSLFEMATSNLSKEEMVQLFSRAMAGYNQIKPPPQEEFNPNKRNQDGDHPDGMQVEATPIKETISDADIAKMECDEDDEDYFLRRDAVRKTNKKQKKVAKANSSTTQGPFGALMKATAKAYSFATGNKTIPSSEPVFNPYKDNLRTYQPKVTLARILSSTMPKG